MLRAGGKEDTQQGGLRVGKTGQGVRNQARDPRPCAGLHLTTPATGCSVAGGASRPDGVAVPPTGASLSPREAEFLSEHGLLGLGQMPNERGPSKSIGCITLEENRHKKEAVPRAPLRRPH